LLAFAYCLLLISCYSPRYVYSPVSTNVPLLSKKGDSKLAGYYAVNPGEKNETTSAGKLNSGYGLDLQAAYAVTNHFALQGSYAKRWEKNYSDFNINSTDSSLVIYERNSTEFGLGYYTFIDKRKASFFQLFAGAGFGRSSFTDKYFNGSLARYFAMDVTRLYIQPAIVIRYGEVFASSLSSRVGMIMFRNISSDYSAEELDKYQLNNLDKDTKIFWEPAFVNAFGLKKLPGLKLEIQLTMAFLMTQKFVDYRTYNLSAGLVLDIPKFFKKKIADKN
jgi:hypothetical protein